jgi:hypothetical protein
MEDLQGKLLNQFLQTGAVQGLHRLIRSFFRASFPIIAAQEQIVNNILKKQKFLQKTLAFF